MKKAYLFLLALLLMLSALSSCTAAPMEGYVLRTEEDRLVYVRNLELENGVVGAFGPLCKKGSLLRADREGAYYVEGKSLYRHAKGKTTLVRDFFGMPYVQYEEGMALSFAEGNLQLSEQGGSVRELAEQVTFICRTEQGLLYVSDGDLYCYDGKEGKLLREGVSSVTPAASIEPSFSFGYQFYS